MARLSAYECENEGCNNLFRKEERTRITVSTRHGGDPVHSVTKDICPSCSQQMNVRTLFRKPADETVQPDSASPALAQGGKG